MTEMRGPARFTLGTACSHPTWVRPPITSRSPDAGEMSLRLATAAGSEQERALRAERDDRDQRVVEVTQLAVAMGRDAVAAVPVVVEADPAQRDVVVLFERGPHGCEGGMRQRLVG